MWQHLAQLCLQSGVHWKHMGSLERWINLWLNYFFRTRGYQKDKHVALAATLICGIR